MLLINVRDEILNIDSWLISDNKKETKILCRGEIPEDDFLHGMLTASFGDESFTNYAGEASIETNGRVLHDDQFLFVC